ERELPHVGPDIDDRGERRERHMLRKPLDLVEVTGQERGGEAVVIAERHAHQADLTAVERDRRVLADETGDARAPTRRATSGEQLHVELEVREDSPRQAHEALERSSAMIARRPATRELDTF